MFEQDRVLVRLQQKVLVEKDILICFLTGSYGLNTQDPYSDLDVTLVFDDEASRSRAYARRKEFVRSVLPYVAAKSFDATHIRPYLHIALYANGAKVDYLYETMGNLEPSQKFRKIRILKDLEGWGLEFQTLSSQQSLAPRQVIVSSDELADLDNRFWAMFMDIYRQLLRGDYSKPFTTYLQLLYFVIPYLLNLLPEEDTAYQAFIQVYYTHDTKATSQHLRLLLRAYLEARTVIIRRYNIDFVPDLTFEREILHLVEKL